MAAAVEAPVEIRLTEDKLHRLQRGELYFVSDNRDPKNPLSVLKGCYRGLEFARFLEFTETGRERTGYPFSVLREHFESGVVRVYTPGGFIISKIAGELGYIPDTPEEAIKRSWLLREPLDDKGIKAINEFYSDRGLWLVFFTPNP